MKGRTIVLTLALLLGAALPARAQLAGLPTYRACVSGLASAASATDIFTITGSATKTAFVRAIIVDGTQTTAGFVKVIFVKRSTADTGGTSASVTAVALDSADPAATATVLSYTANPTTGTAVGNIEVRSFFLPAPATASGDGSAEGIYGEIGWNKPVALRGITEVLAVNLAGVSVTGGAFNVCVEWGER